MVPLGSLFTGPHCTLSINDDVVIVLKLPLAKLGFGTSKSSDVGSLQTCLDWQTGLTTKYTFNNVIRAAHDFLQRLDFDATKDWLYVI